MKAIIPAAGRGKRLRPLTEFFPKELVPVGRRMAIEHALNELAQVHVTDVAIVLAPAKASVSHVFENAAAKYGLVAKIIYDDSYSGPASAILRCENWMDDDSVIVTFPDCILYERDHSVAPPMPRLLKAHREVQSACTLLCEAISDSSGGPADYFDPSSRWYDKTHMSTPLSIERISRLRFLLAPQAEELVAQGKKPVTIVPAARWIIEPCILDYLRELPARSSEVFLSDTVPLLASKGECVCCVSLTNDEERIDIGTWSGLFRAWGLEHVWERASGGEWRDDS
jgi:UTP-glucose-1-phosphate uridylyltransferase